MRLALALHLALALSSALAAEPAATSEYCDALAQRSSSTPRSTPVRLLWGAAPARAAAALLRAALLQAGYRAVALHHEPAAARLCTLAARPRPAAGAPVHVAVAAAWAPADGCALGGTAFRPQGAGAAPVAPRLLERLAPHRAACAGLRSRDFYRDVDALRECGFLDDATENATVYIPTGEWELEAKELRRRLADAKLGFERADRAELARLVRESPRSFLLLDAELWEELEVRPAPPAPGAPRNLPVAFSVADEYALRTRAPALVALLPRFAPTARDLRRVLEADRDEEEAACELAAGADAPRGFVEWRDRAAALFVHKALAIFCESEREDLAEYRFAGELARDHIFNFTTRDVGVSIEVQFVATDCLEPSRLARFLVDEDGAGALAGAIGAALPAELAVAVAPIATDLGLPLIAYEPADESSAAGRPERLAAEIGRLLDACGWRRVALLADGSRAAAALRAALHVRGGLRLREERAATPADAARAVGVLAGERVDARVIVVTAGAPVAERALAAGLALGLTPEAGFAWIVRDYGAADAATAALRPYSVSAQWRGGGAAAADLRDALERRWRERAWPRHASAMVDALLTLGAGFRRRVLARPALLDYAREDDGPRSFWEHVRNERIAGVVEALTYDERGVAAPRVLLSRWGRAARPSGLPAGACPDRAPPSDGTARCLVPAGDPFTPSCRDPAWAGGLVALALAAAMLSLGANLARQALSRRDRRVRERVAARMLAGRERAFAALAKHLVDPTVLELRHELGAGRFGVVRLGVLRLDRRRPVVVAAKGLRADAPPDEEARFLREACTLVALQHERIVRFQGVCVADGPPLLLMEHAFFGDLLRYLHARRHLAEGAEGAEPEPGAAGPEEAAHVSAEALTRLAREAAEALAHLARHRLVHRDVRAANCLVDGRRSLKLADFGLARQTGDLDGEYACRGRALVPLRWMAPESIADGVWSGASDVWSFGALALELVTLGALPYGAASPAEVVRAVRVGGTAPLPRDASTETRALTLACWQREPAARPSAARLAAWLARRRRALRPALAPLLAAPDADSGFGESADAPDAP